MADVVFIHGLFLNHASWSGWAERFTSAGHNARALAWPGLEGSVEELRRDPTPLMTLTIANVLESLDATIRRMDPQPIIIGHSFGGLFAQLLAYRGLGSAVVGLDSTAPAGVLSLPFSTIKASAPVLANPLNIGGATMLTPEQFQYAFTNTITAEESKLLYDRFAIPCANRILFEGAFENFAPHSPARIESAEDRPPILLVAGGADHLVTPSYTKSNFDLISASEATTAYKEFPGRPHFTGAVEGWEEVADFVLAWALNPVARHPDPVDSFRS